MTQDMWVYDEAQDSIVKRLVTYVPGLYKIFDEIIVNAADNKQRDSNMSKLKVRVRVCMCMLHPNRRDFLFACFGAGGAVIVLRSVATFYWVGLSYALDIICCESRHIFVLYRPFYDDVMASGGKICNRHGTAWHCTARYGTPLIRSTCSDKVNADLLICINSMVVHSLRRV